MKPASRRLSLARETLRELSGADLLDIAAAGPIPVVNLTQPTTTTNTTGPGNRTDLGALTYCICTSGFPCLASHPMCPL
ncbi:MAG TPA: hypothetical protein VG245_06865 [Candidatus Dormibacteraeota bacterium]|nr:hypothetical protein [Candidatus Dormibacteraeota bacterium]